MFLDTCVNSSSHLRMTVHLLNISIYKPWFVYFEQNTPIRIFGEKHPDFNISERNKSVNVHLHKRHQHDIGYDHSKLRGYNPTSDTSLNGDDDNGQYSPQPQNQDNWPNISKYLETNQTEKFRLQKLRLCCRIRNRCRIFWQCGIYTTGVPRGEK